jgi:hypothetical protein
MATQEGLCRYPRMRGLDEPARTLPERILTERDGMSSKSVYKLYEDSRGHVWISTIGPDDVERWSRTTRAIERHSDVTMAASLVEVPPFMRRTVWTFDPRSFSRAWHRRPR